MAQNESTVEAMDDRNELVDWDESQMLEVELPDEDAFLKVRETLTRIGIPSKKDQKLYQSCHILHKRGKYYIVHFKEMFALDGKPSSLTVDDMRRRNTIAKLLEDWGLVTVVNREVMDEFGSTSHVKVLKYNEKDDWELVAKYNIGNKG